MQNSEELNILKQIFSGLSESDKKKFLEFASNNGIERSEIAERILQENSFAPEVCPHCGSIHFKKNGTKSGHQRYICHDCKKSFISSADTILFSTKKDMEVWVKYIECMIDKLPLRKCAEKCGISTVTAFSWRHKILDTLREMMDDVTLDGIVEADETFFRLSYKGNHKNSTNFKMPRQSHKRGTPARRRGLSQEQVCVPCGINLSGQSISKVSGLGKPSLRTVESVLSGRIATDAVFVTDSFRAYSKLSNDMELNHIRIPRNKHSVGTFNIQTVNNYHSQLKRMVFGNFKGVSTKHLNNYLVYHNFVNFAKETTDEKKKILFNHIHNTKITSKVSGISNRPAIPLLA